MNYRITISHHTYNTSKDFYFKKLPSLEELRDRMGDNEYYLTLLHFEEIDWPKEVRISEHILSTSRTYGKISVAIRPFKFEEDR